MDAPQFQRLAEVAVDHVHPEPQGFSLSGRGGGADRAEYRLDLHFDVPLDARTRAVLGELLSQSEVTVSRLVIPGRSEPAAARERAHKTSGRRVTAD